MKEHEEKLTFHTDEDEKWFWVLIASGEKFKSPKRFDSKPEAINNFLLLITMGNAEIARAVKEYKMFQ